MIYRAYKLFFSTGVHFGDGSLYESKMCFTADTLFSALCIEAVKAGEDRLSGLVSDAKSGKLLISDAMPFSGDRFYIPKPVLHIEQAPEGSEDIAGKQYKKLVYICVSDLQDYLSGRYEIEKASELDGFGCPEVRDLAAVRQEGEPLPYRVGAYHYSEGNGLYVIAGFVDEETEGTFDDLLTAVSLSGIGGKRHSGLGKFSFRKQDATNDFGALLEGDHAAYMLLSSGLPADSELEKAMEGATYRLVKKSGFVQSDSFSSEQLRKRDTFLFCAGSVFRVRFSGSILDVGTGGSHPVYRYAAPLLLGMDI